MPKSSLLVKSIRCSCQAQRSWLGLFPSNRIHISATPTAEYPGNDFLNDICSDPADARFEVLGYSFSILSVSLSASQILYTQKGTLIGLHGKAEDVRMMDPSSKCSQIFTTNFSQARSRLFISEPFRRALLGIPFVYQTISSASPTTVLISTKSPTTSFTVLNLNGTIDWMIAQPRALIAWTGQSLSLLPATKRGLGIAHWGNTKVTGRGVIALSGTGNIYKIQLRVGEKYIAHPSNVIAYTLSQHLPQPYRLFGFQLHVSKTGFFSSISNLTSVKSLRTTNFWRYMTYILLKLRIFMSHVIWGNQMFLKFYGPATILISSRAARINDVLSSYEVNEIVEAKPRTTSEANVNDKNDNQGSLRVK